MPSDPNPHDAVLNLLLGLRTAKSVHLVAKRNFGHVSFPRGRASVFVPDLHLLSNKVAKEYKYSFVHDEEGPVKRGPLLTELGRKLLTLKSRQRNPVPVDVYQLGDFIDIWREARIRKMEPVGDLTRRILGDNPGAEKYIADRSSLNTRLVIGNHDHVGKSPTIASVPGLKRIKTAHAVAGGDIIVSHGDLMDKVEQLPDRAVRRLVRRFGPIAPSGRRKIGKPLLISSLEDVPRHHGLTRTHYLMTEASAYAEAVRKGEKWALKELGLKKRAPASVFVVGHTHKARLARSGDVIIMDCGAWIERCRIGDAVVPSCQLGVIARADSGAADLRIYQLTPFR